MYAVAGAPALALRWAFFRVYIYLQYNHMNIQYNATALCCLVYSLILDYSYTMP